jgi:transposase
MRGNKRSQEELFHYFSVEERIPQDHPLRSIRALCDKLLRRMSDTFDTMYSDIDRPSLAPEVLLKSTILMALYSVRSERQFCEQLNYNILFRWFLGMDLSEAGFERSVFSTNRARLIEHEVSREFFGEVVSEARARKLVSEEHFTVDGTLIEPWASIKSFVSRDKQDKDDRNDGNGFKPSYPDVNFLGERRTNSTHSSMTGPEALHG